MQKLHLDFDKRSYDIVISDSFADFPREFSAVSKGKVLIVTDSNVAPLYLDEIRRLLYCAGIARENTADIVIEAGEQSKNIDVLQTIYDACIQHGLDRMGTILALGGGVVGDMAGLAAATYMRGIRFVQVPTTLLAQTDSSVGGKVGIDYQGVKNIVGAFKQPALVYINLNTLKSLPPREFSAGMAEVIKYGVIKNVAFLKYLEENVDKIHALDAETMQTAIYNCCAVKAGVVMQDETERGLRAILNFGHTIGHGIESAKEFRLLHGECVALGMLGALQIALARGYVTKQDVELCRNLMLAFGLPQAADGLDSKTVLGFMKNDKKIESGTLRFVLPRPLGAADVYDDVSQAEMVRAIDSVLA